MNNKGSTLVITLFICVVMIVLFAGIIDVSRYFYNREIVQSESVNATELFIDQCDEELSIELQQAIIDEEAAERVYSEYLSKYNIDVDEIFFYYENKILTYEIKTSIEFNYLFINLFLKETILIEAITHGYINI